MNNDQQRPAPKVPPRRPIFDVVRPGMTPANPTSRPVIARPGVKDPGVAMSGVGEAAKRIKLRQDTPADSSTPTQPAPVAPNPAPLPPPQPAVAQPSRPVIGGMQPSEDLGKAAIDGALDQTTNSEDLFAPDPKPVQDVRTKHSIVSELLAVLAIVFLLAVIVDILLDADVINLPLPHTNFFDY